MERVIALQPRTRIAGHHAAVRLRGAQREYFDEIPDTPRFRRTCAARRAHPSVQDRRFRPEHIRRPLRGSRGRDAEAQAGRCARVEADGRGAGFERRQSDGSRPPQRRAGKACRRAAPAKKGAKAVGRPAPAAAINSRSRAAASEPKAGLRSKQQGKARANRRNGPAALAARVGLVCSRSFISALSVRLTGVGMSARLA